VPTQIRDYGRLTLLAFLVGLVATRLGLVLHEFLGHAATAAAVGCDIDGYYVFWFGGGYVRYSRAEAFSLGESLFVALGGLALEIIIGVICLLWARKLKAGSVWQITVLGFGVGHLLHSLHYMAGGSYHGYGDPWIVYRELGESRVYLSVALAVVMCALGFVLARHLAGFLRGGLAGHGKHSQLAIIVAAVVTAGGMHAGLAFGEQALAPNRTYKATFKSMSQRKVDHGVRRYRVMVKRKRGKGPTKAEVAAMRRRLAKKHKTFPFALVMSVCLVISVIGGVFFARASAVTEASLPSPSGQRWLALVAAGSLGLVGLLRALSSG